MKIISLKYVKLLYLDFLAVRAEWRRKRLLRKKARQLRRARKLADIRHATDGRRYYVLPDYNGNLRALNMSEIKALKRAKIMDKRVDVYHLLNEAVYITKNQIDHK